MASKKIITLNNLNQYSGKVDTKYVKKAGDSFTGILNVEGALNLPNSPDNPEIAVVTDSYSIRQTANPDVTGLTVVDNSVAEVLRVEGNTLRTFNEFDISKISNSKFTIDNNNISLTNSYSTPSGKTVKELFPNVQANVTYTCACTTTQDADSTESNCMILVLNGSEKSMLVRARSSGKAGDIAYCKKIVVFTEEDLSKYVYFYGLRSGTLTWSNLILVEGDYSNKEMPAYSSFFIGLKNVSFKGITSNGENLCHVTSDSEVFKVNPSMQFDADTQTITVPAGSNYNTMPSICKLPIPIPAGTTVTVSVFFESGYITAGTVRITGYHSVIGNYAWATDYSNINTRTDLAGTIHSHTSIVHAELPLTDIVLFIYSGTIIETDLKFRVMLTIGDTVPMEFKKSGLVSTLLLPETIETGLGTTIDFENKKILNYGVDIVLTGQENWKYYWYRGGYSPEGVSGVFSDNVCTSPGSKVQYTISDYISTDSIHPRNYTSPGTMWCGYGGTKNFFWIGILDNLGFTTKGVELTTEEQATAITNFKAYLAQRYADGNPIKIRYISSELQSEIPFTTAQKNAGNVYTVWDGGSEIIEGNVNETYRVFPTITQKYSIHENPKEAANKAYVKNGLAKKLDKTGGTITGHLVVENGTNTTLSALIVTNNKYTYGLALENDTYKLGEGSIDNENKFTFNDGEGLPIALRDDSSAFADGELVKWTADGNKLSATGINVAKLSDISRLNALIDGLTDAQIAALNNFAKTLS